MNAEPVDLEVLRSFIGDDPSELSASVTLFVESATRARAELQDAAGAGDADTAGAVAHRFKSVARYLGATALAASCERLERLGKEGDLTGIRKERPQMEAELARVLDALSRITGIAREPSR